MMTKYILYLALSVLPLSISARSIQVCCVNCTDFDFTTINNTLTAQAWQAADGSLWRFLANGRAVASRQDQDHPVIAQWEWQRSEDCWHLSVASPQGQQYFQVPLTASGDLLPNNSQNVLQKSKAPSQPEDFMQQLQGQWRASLGRDAGILSLSLYQNGRFEREYTSAQAKTKDAGYWTLSPDQRFLILFSKKDIHISMMRIPYVELDEMVLEPVTDQVSWFFNRL